MRHPTAHKFLAWAGPAVIVSCGGGIGLVAAIAPTYPGVKDWGENWFHYLYPVVTASWFVLLLVLAICAYLGTLVWTGSDRKGSTYRLTGERITGLARALSVLHDPAHLAQEPWWQGRVFFTLKEAGCLVAGVQPSQYAHSERAQSVANEIFLLARASKTPLAAFDKHPHIESYPKGASAPLILEYRVMPGQNAIFDNGECDLDSVMTKRQISRLAKTSGWNLPW